MFKVYSEFRQIIYNSIDINELNLYILPNQSYDIHIMGKIDFKVLYILLTSHLFKRVNFKVDFLIIVKL